MWLNGETIHHYLEVVIVNIGEQPRDMFHREFIRKLFHGPLRTRQVLNEKIPKIINGLEILRKYV